MFTKLPNILTDFEKYVVDNESAGTQTNAAFREDNLTTFELSILWLVVIFTKKMLKHDLSASKYHCSHHNYLEMEVKAQRSV